MSTDESHSKELRSSIDLLKWNFIFQLSLRLISFILNGMTIRLVGVVIHGIVNVRLFLLHNSVLFLTREAVRKVYIGADAHLDSTKRLSRAQLIDRLWLVLPRCLILCALAIPLWTFDWQPINWLFEFLWRAIGSASSSSAAANKNSSQSALLLPYFFTSVLLYALGACLEIAAEPLYILSQINLHVRLRVAVEAAVNFGRTFFSLLLFYLWPQLGLLAFALTHAVFGGVFVIAYFGFFVNVVRKNVGEARSVPPRCSPPTLLSSADDAQYSTFNTNLLFSVRDVLPSAQIFQLAQSVLIPRDPILLKFYVHCFLKHFLTEGEKICMTFLNTMSLAEQGVFDAISSLGSLAPRIVFHTIEESAHLYFARKIARATPVKQQRKENVAECLHYMRVMFNGVFLLACLIFVYAQFFSDLLLWLYAGQLLLTHSGPTLLRLYSGYVMLLAVNGISEAFYHSQIAERHLDRYNLQLVLLSVTCFTLAIFTLPVLGGAAFILVNCINMAVRIAISLCFVREYFGPIKQNPVWFFAPSLHVCVYFVMALLVRFLTLLYLDWCSRLLVGGLVLAGNLAVIFYYEVQLTTFCWKKFSHWLDRKKSD